MMPKGWKIAKLGELATAITSGSRDWAQFYSNTGSKFIRMGNLVRNGVDLNLKDLKYVDVKSNSADGKRTSLQHGDILISITAELGKIGWVPPDFGEAYINQHVALVRVDPVKADSRFIAYLLSSQHLNKAINKLNDAGAKAGLTLPTIKSVKLLMPTLSEQQKIAAILKKWDEAIGLTEQLIEKKRKYKKILSKRLLDGILRFSGFNDKWKTVFFKDIFDIKIGGTPSRSKQEYWDYKKQTNNRWLSIADLKEKIIMDTKEYISDAGAKNSNVNLFGAGTIVVSFKLTIGKKAILGVDCYTNEAICALLIREAQKVDKMYVFQALENVDYTQEIDQAIKGKTLNKAKLNRLKIKTPVIEEQRKIALFLSVCDNEIEILQKSLDCSIKVKKALMQQLLLGKKRVN